MDNETVIVITNTRVDGEVTKEREAILYVGAQEMAFASSTKDKWVGGGERIDRVRYDLALVSLEILEGLGRIEAELFAHEGAGELTAELDVMFAPRHGDGREAADVSQAAILKGDDGRGEGIAV